jgi:hypothetical protein
MFLWFGVTRRNKKQRHRAPLRTLAESSIQEGKQQSLVPLSPRLPFLMAPAGKMSVYKRWRGMSHYESQQAWKRALRKNMEAYFLSPLLTRTLLASIMVYPTASNYLEQSAAYK